MNRYFIYARKSSEDEDRQILSIEAQLSELYALAQQHGLLIAETFTESKSAKEPGRPVFNRMMCHIERGEANGILSWKLDRLARNFDDGGKIIGMLQRGAIQEIRTFEKTYLPSDNVLMIAVEFGMANQYIRDLSVNIRRGIREKVRRGVFSGRAPLGYSNDPRLRTIEPHPEMFPKVKRLLELFATGDYTLTALQQEATKLGITGRQNNKPVLHLSTLGNLLRCQFYYGVFVHKGEIHQGMHVPMISKKTFDEIQAALVAVAKPRKRQDSKGFFFLDFATCGSCGHCITGERHIKTSGRRFHYYRCTHKGPACEERVYLRDEKFNEEVKRNVQLATLPKEWMERFLDKLETSKEEAAVEAQEQINEIKIELDAVRVKIDRINNGFTDGSIDIREFKELKNPLVTQKVVLEQNIATFRQGSASWLEPMKNWIFQANQPEKWVLDNNWGEMKAFLKRVGSNRLLQAQTLTVTFKKPWNYLAETNMAVRSTAEISEQNLKWWRRWELNPRPLPSTRE